MGSPLKNALRKAAVDSKWMRARIAQLEQHCADSDIREGVKWLVENQNRITDFCNSTAQAVKNLTMRVQADQSGEPYLYAFVRRFVSENHGGITEEKLIAALHMEQERQMTLQEGFLLPTVLCAELLKLLADQVQYACTVRDCEIRIAAATEQAEVHKAEKMLYEDPQYVYALIAALERHKKRNNGDYEKLLKDYFTKNSLEREAWLESMCTEHVQCSVVMKQCIVSLIRLQELDIEHVVYEAFASERKLYFSANDAYRISDKRTRTLYRDGLDKICRYLSLSEEQVLEELDCVLTQEKNAQAGDYLFGYQRFAFMDRLSSKYGVKRGLFPLKKPVLRVLYWIVMAGSILFMALPLPIYCASMGGTVLQAIILGLFCIAPAYVMSQILINGMLNLFIKPSVLPRLKENMCFREVYRTAVTVPCIVGTIPQAQDALKRIERHYLSNEMPNCVYVLLADFAPSKHEITEEERAVCRFLCTETEKLNSKYGTESFIYLHRSRVYKEKEKEYAAWERKRGAISELCGYCYGREFQSLLCAVNEEKLRGIRYILTLDLDTQMQPGSLCRLIGTIAHPLNAPVIDERGRVVRGYGLIQPAMTTDIKAAEKTYFSKLYSPGFGINAYPCGASDVFQDLFDGSSFGGKGIFDVRAYMLAVEGRMPENLVLSHDLLEGEMLRCATVYDAAFSEGFPQNVAVYYGRAHRWTRGDWQHLPWLGRYCGRLRAISKWKIIGNLLRSMFASSLLAVLLLGLLPAGGSFAMYAFFVLQAVFYPLGLDIFASLVAVIRAENRRYMAVDALEEIWQKAKQMVASLVFLPYEAVMMCDAKVKALFRIYVSGKNRLQWVAFRQEKNNRQGSYYFSKLWSCVVYGAALMLLAYVAGADIPQAFLFAAAFASAPLLAWHGACECESGAMQHLNPQEDDILRLLGLRTFSYFYASMTQENNWLPPDNDQIRGGLGYAQRTSPTNIGYGILAFACACRMRYIPLADAVKRIEKTLESVEGLEKYRGNLYNWYHIKKAEPLAPKYVSSVDSGNFCCCVLAAASLLRAELDRCVFDDGLKNTFAILLHYYDEEELAPAAYEKLQDFLKMLESVRTGSDGLAFAEAVVNCKEFKADRRLSPMLQMFRAWAEHMRQWGGRKEYCYKSYREAEISELTEAVEQLSGRMENLAAQCDLACLFDSERKLFYIGYDAENGRPSEHHYDILASESRLTSYYAIASGKVEAAHWFRLGRTCAKVGEYSMLLSWSGTMFEYLMPELFLQTEKQTILGISAYGAIQAQRHYVKGKLLPWGISESAYKETGRNGEYRYFAFGVKQTALDYCRTTRVIAPYASMLALPFFPQAVFENLIQLVRYGGCGEYGLYEAIDFTDSPVVVKTYMAHHQGMTLAALCNYLCNSALKKAFMRIDMIHADRMLLDENIPRGIAPRLQTETKIPKIKCGLISRQGKETVCALGNGSLCGVYGISGSGLFMGETALEPYVSEKYVRGAQHIYIRFAQDEIWREIRWEQMKSSIASVQYTAHVHHMLITQTVFIMPNQNTEVREFHFSGEAGGEIQAELLFGKDVYLCTERDYRAHPAYRNLFVQSAQAEGGGVRLTRRKVETGEAVHLRLKAVGEYQEAVYCDNRYDFLGRNQYTVPDGEFSGIRGGALTEPMAGVRVKFRLHGTQERKLHLFSDVLLDDEAGSEQLEPEKGMQNAVSKAIAQATFIGMESEAQQRYFDLCTRLFTGRTSNVKGSSDVFYRLSLSDERKSVLLHCVPESSFSEFCNAYTACRHLFETGYQFDLIVLDETAPEYSGGMHNRVQMLAEQLDGSVKGSVVYINDLAPEQKEQLIAAVDAYVPCFACGADEKKEPAELPAEMQRRMSCYPPSKIELPALILPHCFGGFCAEGYFMRLSRGETTPRPWVNVVSNGAAGFVAAENGIAFSFGKNSSLEKITMPQGDPVFNAPSGIIYLRDEETAEYWTLTNAPINRGDDYGVLHGFGYTEYRYNAMGLAQSAVYFTAEEKGQRIALIRLKNMGEQPRRISVSVFENAELQEKRADRFCTGGVKDGYAYVRRGDGIQFLYSPDAACLCADKNAFLGAGTVAAPEAMRYEAFLPRAGGGVCLALRMFAELEPYAERVFAVVLSGGKTEAEIEESIAGFSVQEAEGELARVKGLWEKRLRSIEIQTPDARLNVLMNGWLLYQTWSSRFLARCGFSQIGGAYGFRDQLQDMLSLQWVDPELARNHILRCAMHQFPEGDVQHWWHEGFGGVRTHISDDRLWLVYVASEYADMTGDYAIFDEKIPYLEGRAPELGKDVYENAKQSEFKESLYEHCVKALTCSMRLGSDGLPLMGDGDWNDGMNRVGSGGKGQSVWLAWLLLSTIGRFLTPVERRGDRALKEKLVHFAAQLLKSVEENAWNGKWYIRAICDDGTKIGDGGAECAIDGITQAWAVLSGCAEHDRAVSAMECARKILTDRQAGIVKLLWPPIKEHNPYLGYIQEYPKGVRENGGQYTHGAIWIAGAEIEMGQKETGYEMLSMMNPVAHTASYGEMMRYGAEPYVIAADINPDGAAGWSWYTGAAGWYYRTVLCELLGIKRHGNFITVRPSIPEDWEKASVTLHCGKEEFFVEIFRSASGEKTVLFDGKRSDGEIPITGKEGKHNVKVIV